MLIVTGSDDNYVPGVLALIASAAFHNPDADFAVLDMGITPVNRDRIDQLATRLGVRISRIEVDSATFDNLLIKREHLTSSAYLRLLIPQLFPDEGRVLYLDCDMIVCADLSLLFQIDLGSDIIAAVACPSPDPIEVSATGHTIGSYVNSGLLVMNLPLWRAEGIAEKCIELLSDPENPLLSEDQSAINIVARGRTKLLPARFNVYSDPGSYDTVADFPDPPAVIHYVVNNKPWNWGENLGEIWHFHAQRIADLMPPRKPKSLRRRLSLLNRRRKQWMWLFLRSKKHRSRRLVAMHMNGTVADNYLSSVRQRKVPAGAAPRQAI